MKLEPPQPPTAPAPAIRPTPPTPPHIDKSPFAKADSGTTEKTSDDVYEDMARDAVANGSGALTKRTVDKGENENPPANQTVTVIPPDAPLVNDSQPDYERGQDILREFQDLDARETQKSTYNPPAQTSTEQSQPSTPKFTHQESNGAFFWVFTIIFVAIATFFIVKKFLLTEKPALTKSQLFEDEKKATTDKMPPQKPAILPKKDDNKGKRFEIRI